MKKNKLVKILIIIIILILILTVAFIVRWYFGDFLKHQKIISRVSSWEFTGYEMGGLNINEEDISLSYQPKDNENKDIQRVTGNIAVKIKTYATPEEAQQQIEKASLVYIWQWRKEKILNHQVEVSTGFLFSPEEERYKEAYLAWVQDSNTYYEFIARPDDIRDFSDKEYLYSSAKDVAEGVLSNQ